MQKTMNNAYCGEDMKTIGVFRYGIFIAVLFFAALCFIGCGGGPKKVSVSGQVTLDGQPIKDCAVLFQAVNPGEEKGWRPDATGVTDAEGRYNLSSLGAHAGIGAAAGEYVVKFGWSDPNPPTDESTPPAQPPYQLPQDAQINGIKFTVPAKGTTEADFQLTGSKNAGR